LRQFFDGLMVLIARKGGGRKKYNLEIINMAKFEKKNRLNAREQQKLLLELCHALVVVKKEEEAAHVLIDLLSKQEIDMIAKRLKIAKLLAQGKTYNEIHERLRVSQHTIARVNAWLDAGGAGFRLIISRDRAVNIPEWQPATWRWDALKRRYPMYYWPQILLEEVVRSANNRQRRKLINTLKVLKVVGQKPKLFQQLERVLAQKQKVSIKHKL